MFSVLHWIEEALGKLLLAAIVLLLFVAAVSRSFDHPIIWSVDLSQVFFVWLCFVGALKALSNRAHIGVDYFVQKLPYAVRRVIDLFLAVLAVVFLVAMAWYGMELALMNWQRIDGDSGIPYAWVTMAVPVGCGFLALVLIYQIIVALRTGVIVFGKHDIPAKKTAPAEDAEDLVQQEL